MVRSKIPVWEELPDIRPSVSLDGLKTYNDKKKINKLIFWKVRNGKHCTVDTIFPLELGEILTKVRVSRSFREG